MPWQQLANIIEENRRQQAEDARTPPVACPIDGTPLQVNGRGERNCPLGNFQWQTGDRIP